MNRNLNLSDDLESIARQTVDAIFHVHRTLGPGLLESVYSSCLEEELRYRGVAHVREVPIALTYRERSVEIAFRADCIVAGSLLLELKTVEGILPVHRAQVITYLKLTNIPLALLVNFNVPLIKDGIHRLFNPSLT